MAENPPSSGDVRSPTAVVDNPVTWVAVKLPATVAVNRPPAAMVLIAVELTPPICVAVRRAATASSAVELTLLSWVVVRFWTNAEFTAVRGAPPSVLRFVDEREWICVALKLLSEVVERLLTSPAERLPTCVALSLSATALTAVEDRPLVWVVVRLPANAALSAFSAVGLRLDSSVEVTAFSWVVENVLSWVEVIASNSPVEMLAILVAVSKPASVALRAPRLLIEVRVRLLNCVLVREATSVEVRLL